MTHNPLRAFREQRALLDDLADIRWTDPAWLATIATTAALESLRPSIPHANSEAAYLGNDGGPQADTFAATPKVPVSALAHQVQHALVLAKAASATLAAMDGTFPDQPLAVAMRWRGRQLTRAPIDVNTTAFITPHAVWLGCVSADDDQEIARDLSRALAGQPQGRFQRLNHQDREPTPAAFAIGVGVEQLETARHLHRRAWTRGGGPWLGLGSTVDQNIATTCHFAVDGYAHMLITSQVLGALSSCPNRLLAAAQKELGNRPALGHFSVLPEAEALGIATTNIPSYPGFAASAHAFGCALALFYRRKTRLGDPMAARFSPTFQVPVAYGDLSDPQRLRRRVVTGLMSVPFRNGLPESLNRFSRRVPPFLRREAAGQGILTRMQRAIAGAPVPTGLKRRLLLRTRSPGAVLAPVEVLSGRGGLSVIRFPHIDRPSIPLIAASAPGLPASSADPLGSAVLTVLETHGGVSATIGGMGAAGNSAGAEELLQLWRNALPT